VCPLFMIGLGLPYLAGPNTAYLLFISRHEHQRVIVYDCVHFAVSEPLLCTTDPDILLQIAYKVYK
jgi:hypothetical protein